MLTGILLFLLLVTLLLAVPLTINFKLHWMHGLSGHVNLAWANGLLDTTIPVQPDEGRERNKPKHKDKRGVSKSPGINTKTLLRNKAFRDRVISYIRDTWTAIEKHELKLASRIGLDDPADTGILWALLGPVSAILATHRNSEISLEPDFLDPVFELQSSGTIRIVPLRHIYLTTKLLLSPTLWSAISRAR